MVRHFIDLFDLNAAEAADLLDRAAGLKAEDRQHGQRPQVLAGRTLGLVFDKPSLRTRVSFEAAITQLGGNALFLNGKDVGLGVRESVADFARVISQYVDALAVRTFSQATIEELARHATIPIINALSDSAHPCQALADLLTVREALGPSPASDSSSSATATTSPDPSPSPPPSSRSTSSWPAPPATNTRATSPPASPPTSPAGPWPSSTTPGSPSPAPTSSTTDVWASMGQEAEAESRRAVFDPYRVDAALLALAKPSAVFLHCLPARRGEEVAEEVLEGPSSLVFPQAANRLHFQKALLAWLLRDKLAEVEAAG